MDSTYIIIIVIFLVLIIIGIIGIGFYNKILFRRKKVEEKLESITKSIEERQNIIQQINTLFAGMSFHEDNLMMELNDLYIKINEKSDSTLNLLNKTDSLLVKALSLDTVYPELARNNDYNKIKDVFKENQYKIMYAIEIYNEEVENYNNYRNKPFINIINKICKFKDYDSYKKSQNEI